MIGSTVGASPAPATQNTPQDAQKSEWTCVSWFNKISDAVANKTCHFFGRAVAAVVSVVAFIPSLAVDLGYAVKSLYDRKIAKSQTPVQNQMPAANGSQTPVQSQAPASTSQAPASEVESLKEQIRIRDEKEKSRTDQIMHKNALMDQVKAQLHSAEHRLSAAEEREKGRVEQVRHKVALMDEVKAQLHKTESQLEQKTRQIARDSRDFDDIRMDMEGELLEQRKVILQKQDECTEHAKNEKALQSLLAEHMEDRARRDGEIQALHREIRQLRDDNLDLMLKRNDWSRDDEVNFLAQQLHEQRNKHWWTVMEEQEQSLDDQLGSVDGDRSEVESVASFLSPASPRYRALDSRVAVFFDESVSEDGGFDGSSNPGFLSGSYLGRNDPAAFDGGSETSDDDRPLSQMDYDSLEMPTPNYRYADALQMSEVDGIQTVHATRVRIEQDDRGEYIARDNGQKECLI